MKFQGRLVQARFIEIHQVFEGEKIRWDTCLAGSTWISVYDCTMTWESAEVKATDSCMSVVFSRCRSTNVFSVHNAGGGLSTQWQVCKIDVRSHHPGLHIQLFSRFQMCNNTMLEKEQGKRNCRLVHCYEAGSQTRMPQLYCVLLEQNINSCKCSPLRN